MFVPSYSTSGPNAPITIAAWAASQKIDHLSNISVDGVSGLKASEIPDLSGSYLSIASTSEARSTLGLSYVTSAQINTSIATWGDSIIGLVCPDVIENITGFRVYDGGLGGDTSTQTKTRMLADTTKHILPTIIEANYNGYTNATTEKSDIAEMVTALQAAGNTHYVVLGVVNGDSASEYSGGGNYSVITQLNSDLAAAYGDHFIDIRAYLVSLYNPDNSQDVTDYGRDVVPSSLRADKIHPNNAGCAAMTRKLMQNPHMADLWSNTNSTVTFTDLRKFFTNNPGARQTLQSSVSQETSTISPAELASMTGWTTTDWTGDFNAGFTHTTGNTTPLYTTLGISSGRSYQISFTISGQTTGGLTVSLGYATSTQTFGTNGTYLIGPKALSASGPLTFTPTTDFNGMITSISVRQIVTGTLPIFSIIDSTGISSLEIRSSPNALGNTYIGREAARSNLNGSANTAIGSYAFYANTTGSNNTSLGNSALYLNSIGSYNTGLGASALRSNTTGSNNIGLGYFSLFSNTTGSNNTGLGNSALYLNSIGSNNTGLGVGVLRSNTTGANNVGLGFQAGYRITTGSNNILLGAWPTSTNANLTTGSGNIIIGYNISATSSTAWNSLNIGNLIFGTGLDGAGTSLSSGSIGIGTTTPWRKFSVTGTVGFDGLLGAVGAGSLCLSANKEVVFNSGSDNCLSSIRATKHDITALALPGTTTVAALAPVSFIYNDDASSTVRYGFIADDAAAIDPHFGTYDATGKLSGIDDRSVLSVVVKAVQELIGQVRDLAATVASFGDRIDTKKLCVAKSDGTSVCVTGDQLASALGGTAGSGANGGQSSGSGTSQVPDTTPPVITIKGETTAHIAVGSEYSDLGATVTDNVDQNLGIHTFVGSTPIEYAPIITTEPTTYHINYVATDSAGNTATSTRTVIVDAPSIIPDQQ